MSSVPGQRGEAVAAVRVGRFPEIIADQLELGVARARVDEIVEQLREGAHRALMHERRYGVSAGGRRARRGSPCDRGRTGCRAPPRHARGRTASPPGGPEQRELRRMARQAFERGKAVDRRRAAGWRPSGRRGRAARDAAPAWRISATRSPTSFLTFASGSVAMRSSCERRSRTLVKLPLRSCVGWEKSTQGKP